MESKRQVPWSEVMNGGPLPPNPYPSYRCGESIEDAPLTKKTETFQTVDAIKTSIDLARNFDAFYRRKVTLKF